MFNLIKTYLYLFNCKSAKTLSLFLPRKIIGGRIEILNNKSSQWMSLAYMSKVWSTEKYLKLNKKFFVWFDWKKNLFKKKWWNFKSVSAHWLGRTAQIVPIWRNSNPNFLPSIYSTVRLEGRSMSAISPSYAQPQGFSLPLPFFSTLFFVLYLRLSLIDV